MIFISSLTVKKVLEINFQGFKKGDFVSLYWQGKHELTAEIATLWSDGVSLTVKGEGWHTFRGSCIELVTAEKQLTLF